MTPAYIGIGSNLDQPERQVGLAIDRLGALPGTRLLAHSSLYQNPPMGPAGQPDYVNAVAALTTSLRAQELLNHLQRLETDQGRMRNEVRWGPRIIDLDLLLYGDEVISEEGLTVPHPGIAERAFVLIPLREVAPDVEIPGLGNTAAMLEKLDCSGLQRMDANLMSDARS